MKDLYTQNYKCLDTNKLKDILCSCITRISIATSSILPKATYRFNAIPTQHPVALSTELEQTTLKSLRHPEDPKEPKQEELGWSHQAL